MNTSIQIARVMGIPIVVNISWFLMLAFVTSMLALKYYPDFAFAPDSPYRDDRLLHWTMAIFSGVVFFASILLHELAHSAVALKQGIPVKNITLFMFGGVSQIAGDARRPLHEFVMAIVGPLSSLLISVAFLAAWWATGFSDETPIAIVVQWLFLMNLVLAAFNMAPGFPMDGGRVLRAMIWGISGNAIGATRLSTLTGRAIGYSLMSLGGLAFFGMLRDYIPPYNGILFVFLGLYLENAARQSWVQAKALDILAKHAAEELMKKDLETATRGERLHYLASRGGRRFMFFIADEDERVVGVLTQQELESVPEADRGTKTAGEVMLRTDQVPVAMLREDGASMLQRMDSEARWHMPVVSDGRVVGVVSKEDLLRLLAANFFPQTPALGQR